VSYVLVSLVGDDATKEADEFARWFAEQYPPTARFHEPMPDHEQVESALRVTPLALVFGHDGGGSLRPTSRGEPWVRPPQFAKLFAGARVWVYACNTRAKKLKDDLESFGWQALMGAKLTGEHEAGMATLETLRASREAMAPTFRPRHRGPGEAG
jgi:hypothetical protein